MRTIRRPWTFLALGLALTACTSASRPLSSPDTTAPNFPSGRTDVVIRVDSCCGFTAPEYQLGLVPSVTIYGNGRVITTARAEPSFPSPGPAYLPLSTGHLDRSEMVALLSRALNDRLLRPRSFGRPGVTDMPTTTVTITSDSPHGHRAYALDPTFPHGDPGLTAEPRGARTALSNFIHAVQTIATTRAKLAYEPSQIAVYARRHLSSATMNPRLVLTWPLADLATSGALLEGTPTDGTGFRCTVFAGSDTSTVLAAATNSTRQTVWTSGVADFDLTFRPLLPDEHACPGLGNG